MKAHNEFYIQKTISNSVTLYAIMTFPCRQFDHLWDKSPRDFWNAGEHTDKIGIFEWNTLNGFVNSDNIWCFIVFSIIMNRNPCQWLNLPNTYQRTCAEVMNYRFCNWSSSCDYSGLEHCFRILGLYSLRRRRFISIGISIINLRRSSDRLRFIMGIPIPVRRSLLSE